MKVVLDSNVVLDRDDSYPFDNPAQVKACETALAEYEEGENLTTFECIEDLRKQIAVNGSYPRKSSD